MMRHTGLPVGSGVWVGVGVMVGVFVAVNVGVCVAVFVGVGVKVAVLVAVFVGDGVGVAVAVAVGGSVSVGDGDVVGDGAGVSVGTVVVFSAVVVGVNVVGSVETGVAGSGVSCGSGAGVFVFSGEIVAGTGVEDPGGVIPGTPVTAVVAVLPVGCGVELSFGTRKEAPRAISGNQAAGSISPLCPRARPACVPGPVCARTESVHVKLSTHKSNSAQISVKRRKFDILVNLLKEVYGQTAASSGSRALNQAEAIFIYPLWLG